MSRQCKRRIDYSILHRYGEKVDKIMDENNDQVTPEDKQVAELKIREDLKFSLGVYADIEEYVAKSEVEEAIQIISEQVHHYSHLHMELRVELGEAPYLLKYPHYDALVKRAVDFLKNARKRLHACEEDTKPTITAEQKDQAEILGMKETNMMMLKTIL